MTFDFHAASTSAAAAPTTGDASDLGPNWGERIVTVIATSVAVTIVAAIAVLMGMA